MNEISRLIEQRLKTPKKCAFLAGAGISVPPPSSLPSAVMFIKEIVNIIDIDNQYNDMILNHLFSDNEMSGDGLDFLRFEAVMATIQMSVDPNLDIIQLYSECKVPNFYHYFLAKQLSLGNVVMTTNFDNLIEIACRDLNVPYDLIIEEHELLSFSRDPNNYNYPLIKLHGGYDAMRYDGNVLNGHINLKATLQQVGSAFPDFQRTGLFELLSTVFNYRHVCIVGYSGCDDFDIIPMLKRVDFQHGMTWLKYSEKSTNVISSTKNEGDLIKVAKYNSPPYSLFRELLENDPAVDMIIVEGKPTEVLCIDTSKDNGPVYKWKPVFDRWKDRRLKTPASRSLLLSIILSNLYQVNEAIKMQEAIDIDELDGWRKDSLNFFLAFNYYETNNFDKSVLYFSKVIASDSDINHTQKGYAYYSLSRINNDKWNLDIAGIYVSAAIKIFEKEKDLARLSDCIHERGRIKDNMQNQEGALRDFECSIEICKKIGDIGGVGMSFAEMASIYQATGEYELCENYLKKAIKYHMLSSNKIGLAIAYHKMGILKLAYKDYDDAEIYYKKALQIENEINAKLHLGHTLHCLGDLMSVKGEQKKARKYFNESLIIKNEIGDEQGIKNSSRCLMMLDLMEKLRPYS